MGGKKMAGIGFRLQKLFEQDYFSARSRAYGYSLFVTAGPWLVVIAVITAVHYLTGFFYSISFNEQQLFTVSVSYCFIFSQIIYGMIQLPVTRYIADRLYEKQIDRVFPSLLGVIKIVLVLASVLWALFAFLTPLPFYYDLLLLVLFFSLCVIWIQTVYLTSAKDYQSITLAFLAGGGVSAAGIIAVVFFHPAVHFQHAQAFLLLACFTLGMTVTLFFLSTVLLRMFPSYKETGQFTFLSSFDRYPELFWSGLFYNAGIWVCNFIIWFGEGHRVVENSFLYNPIYDSAVFWAYLTITPIYVFFTVSIETRFYERYKKFLGAVNHGGTLNQIDELKTAMNVTLRQEISRMIRSQGIFSLIVIFTAWIVMSQYSQQTVQLSIFQLAAIGAFSNGMVLVCMLLLLYFEDRSGALRTAFLLFAAHTLLTLSLFPLGLNGYGISFAVGSGIAFLYSLYRLFDYTGDIDFYLFCPDSRKSGRHFFTMLGERLNRFV